MAFFGVIEKYILGGRWSCIGRHKLPDGAKRGGGTSNSDRWGGYWNSETIYRHPLWAERSLRLREWPIIRLTELVWSTDIQIHIQNWALSSDDVDQAVVIVHVDGFYRLGTSQEVTPQGLRESPTIRATNHFPHSTSGCDRVPFGNPGVDYYPHQCGERGVLDRPAVRYCCLWCIWWNGREIGLR